MVNHLSRSLLAMALFAALCSMAGQSAVSYPLFASGVAAIMLADFARTGDTRPLHRRARVIVCLALPGIGLLGGIDFPLLLILPSAFTAVTLADSYIRRRRRPEQDNQGGNDDDPLANLCISLPSAVVLIAVIALS